MAYAVVVAAYYVKSVVVCMLCVVQDETEL
jgi:hypothetical protein